MSVNDITNVDSPRNSLSLFRVNKMKDLERINAQLTERINILEQCCLQLKEENKKLKQTIIVPINDNNIDVPTPMEPQNFQYQTDEEELARETEWIIQKNKKKRSKKVKDVSSSENSKENKCPTEQNIRNINVNQQLNDDKLRPPPIMISGVNDFLKFHQDIKEIVKDSFLVKMLSSETYKVNTFNSEDYRKLTKHLSESGTSWHSYENKGTRPIKVMVKNLHHSCDINLIIHDLQQQGYKVIEAINKLKFKTKEPLDMFIVSFDSSEDISKIYKIHHICDTIVKVEPIKQQQILPQCKKCQGFGHTKNYCNKPPRCVKCAGKHSSVECNKQIDNPKCCNCGKQHPASYRGCEVAKELQKIRNKKLRQSTNIPTSTNVPRSHNTGSDTISNNTQRRSYASVTQTITSNNDNILSQILQRLCVQEEFFKSIEHRLTQLEQVTLKQ